MPFGYIMAHFVPFEISQVSNYIFHLHVILKWSWHLNTTLFDFFVHKWNCGHSLSRVVTRAQLRSARALKGGNIAIGSSKKSVA